MLGLWIAFTAQREVDFERRRRKSDFPRLRKSSSPDSRLSVWPPVSHGGFPSMTPPKSDRLVTEGQVCGHRRVIYTIPPPPPPSSRAHRSLLCYAAGASPPAGVLPESAGETAAGRPRQRRGGGTHPRPGPGVPGRARRGKAARPPPRKSARSPGAVWRLCQPSRILPASLEWKITASNFAERSWCQHFN